MHAARSVKTYSIERAAALGADVDTLQLAETGVPWKKPAWHHDTLLLRMLFRIAHRPILAPRPPMIAVLTENLSFSPTE